MPKFRHHGFEFPPVGLMAVISQSSVPTSSLIYIIDPIGADLPPLEDLKSLSKNDWVVINTHEPASHLWFDRLISYLTQKCDIDYSRIILHSSCLEDPDSPIKLVGSIVDYATDIVSQLGKELLPGNITHHYVCLNRQRRWQRQEIVNLLRSRNIDRMGQMSYLESSTPIILDLSDVDWINQRSIEHPSIKNAAINLITETAYEPIDDTRPIQHHYCPSLTEKTFKSMYLCQFPVWVAPKNTVKHYRDLGFDAFDDIIDHTYDRESDPKKRLELIADEMTRLVNLDLSVWQDLRDQSIERFRTNLDNLIWYSYNHASELPAWNRIFN